MDRQTVMLEFITPEILAFTMLGIVFGVLILEIYYKASLLVLIFTPAGIALLFAFFAYSLGYQKPVMLLNFYPAKMLGTLKSEISIAITLHILIWCILYTAHSSRKWLEVLEFFFCYGIASLISFFISLILLALYSMSDIPVTEILLQLALHLSIVIPLTFVILKNISSGKWKIYTQFIISLSIFMGLVNLGFCTYSEVALGSLLLVLVIRSAETIGNIYVVTAVFLFGIISGLASAYLLSNNNIVIMSFLIAINIISALSIANIVMRGLPLQTIFRISTKTAYVSSLVFCVMISTGLAFVIFSGLGGMAAMEHYYAFLMEPA